MGTKKGLWERSRDKINKNRVLQNMGKQPEKKNQSWVKGGQEEKEPNVVGENYNVNKGGERIELPTGKRILKNRSRKGKAIHETR